MNYYNKRRIAKLYQDWEDLDKSYDKLKNDCEDKIKYILMIEEGIFDFTGINYVEIAGDLLKKYNGTEVGDKLKVIIKCFKTIDEYYDKKLGINNLIKEVEND